MAKRSTAGLVKYVKFLMEAGVMEKPRWLDALERVPPIVPKPGRRPPPIHFPEDDIIRNYYRRNPGASLEAIDLGSYEPTTARRFATRQLELMEQGKPRREARVQAEKEFAEAAAAANEPGIIDLVQTEEEAHLQQALQTYTERHGHKPMTDAAAARRPLSSREEAMRHMPAPATTTSFASGKGSASSSST